MTVTRIYSPEGRVGATTGELAPLPDSLAERRIVALDNGKPGADALLRNVAERLAARTGARFTGMWRKGSAATPCEPELLRALEADGDLVLTGTAD